MGRIIVITGGTSGIGLALKELFDKNGDTVITFSTRELDDVNHYSGSVSHEIKVKQVFNDLNVACDIRTFDIENEGTTVI